MEYYAATKKKKKKETRPLVPKWKDPEGVVLSEMSQRKTCCVAALVRAIREGRMHRSSTVEVAASRGAGGSEGSKAQLEAG